MIEYKKTAEISTMDMQAMGKFLRDLRKENNITQEELGEKLGVTNKTISRWETGLYMPPSEMLLELSKLYNVTINEILSGERLDTATYQGKAEENIVSTLTDTTVAKRQNKKIAIICGAIILALTFVVGIVLGVFFSSPRYIVITFDSSGGSAVEHCVINTKEAESVNGQYLVNEPVCPTKANSSLVGWYVEPYCFTRWDFSKDTVDSSVTLYAKWETATDGLIYAKDDKAIIDGIFVIDKIPGYAVKGYDSDEKDVIIPSYWQGLPVWLIDGFAFKETEIESVVIPDTVTYISGGVFENCRNLKTVQLGENVTYIGDAAFYNCKNLREIDLPLKLESIGNYTFCGCSSLTEVKTSYYLQKIGNLAFAECTNLLRFTIGSEVLYLGVAAFQDCNSLMEVHNMSNYVDTSGREDLSNVLNVYGSGGRSKLKFLSDGCVVYDLWGENPQLVRYLGNEKDVILPETIGERPYDIYDYAFANSDITSIKIPDGVKTIGKGAFYNCSQLERVQLGNQVTSIGDEAFLLSVKLREINIPDTLTYLGQRAFSTCYELESINLGSITEIRNGTFGWCYNLNSVIVPSGVTTIGSQAFVATGLLEIFISETVTDIANDAFHCNDLWNIVVDERNPVYHSANGNLIQTATKTLLIGSTYGEIPNDGSVTRIAQNAYRQRGAISVNIPACVTEIDVGAFWQNWTIVTITVDENNENYFAVNNCLISKEGRLIFMPKGATIPTDGSVTSIGYHSMSLQVESVIVIPTSVTYIHYDAFTPNRSVTLRYLGTKEQFLQIETEQGYKWFRGVSKVICDDGELFPSDDDFWIYVYV